MASGEATYKVVDIFNEVVKIDLIEPGQTFTLSCRCIKADKCLKSPELFWVAEPAGGGIPRVVKNRPSKLDEWLNITVYIDSNTFYATYKCMQNGMAIGNVGVKILHRRCKSYEHVMSLYDIGRINVIMQA